MGATNSTILTGKDSLPHFFKFLSANTFSQIFVLIDENTRKHCYPVIKKRLPAHKIIRIKSGEKNKTLQACETVWNKLTDANADRNSLLVNLGGGVIGDLGGFAAGCYKRGIRFINLPTTLLAMVDASVGAKTGIDFKGFKNQIGLFKDPEAVFIHTGFLKTLPDRELRAGFAEVIKHYLIADKRAFVEMGKHLNANKEATGGLRKINWDGLVQKNIAIKSKIVSSDKFETGPRKGLNFGHTIGHAVETYFLNKGTKLLHGEAVAIGIVCESMLSAHAGLLPREEYLSILRMMGMAFPGLPHLKKKSIPAIMKLLKQDKKNAGSKNQFTLLKGVGNFTINNTVEEAVIIRSLQYYSDITS